MRERGFTHKTMLYQHKLDYRKSFYQKIISGRKVLTLTHTVKILHFK